MCWVMPPASPAATSVRRMASKRVVLPWSTCPMTVITGGRSTSEAGSSSNTRLGLTRVSEGPSSSGSSISTRKPNRSAKGSTASRGTGAAAAAMNPMDSSALISSTTGRRMALAISSTDIPGAATMTSIWSSGGGSGSAGGSSAGSGAASSSTSGSSGAMSAMIMERRASASPGSRPDEAVVTGRPRSRAKANTSREGSPSSLASSWIRLVAI